MEIVLNKTGETKKMKLTENQVASVCLEACGGGWTEEQTAKAFELHRQARDLKPGGRLELAKGFYLTAE